MLIAYERLGTSQIYQVLVLLQGQLNRLGRPSRRLWGITADEPHKPDTGLHSRLLAAFFLDLLHFIINGLIISGYILPVRSEIVRKDRF
jgi:hypothetical protein